MHFSWTVLAIILIAFGAYLAFGMRSDFSTPTAPAQAAGGEGAHCGGFIQNAPMCAAGFHCQLNVSNPDTGGICVKN